jgi:hypothetical protein
MVKEDNPEEQEETIITEIKSEDKELENIIEDLNEITIPQTTSKIIDPSLKISNIIPAETLEQGLRDIPTENNSDNNSTQYGIQDDDYSSFAGDYDSMNSDDSQGYVSDIDTQMTEPSLSMDNTSQNPMQSTNATGYPGTGKRKKNKTYHPTIHEGTEEEKRKKRRGIW